MPRALLNASGDPVPGVRREYLHGLAPEDAEAMLRRAGINGDSERMRNYLKRAFDCHPLVVGFVAGLVRKSPWARMDFERWVNDTRGGGAVDLTDPDLRQRQTNILKLAFDVLEPRTRDLLARLGMLANAVDLTVLEALNPTLPEPPPQPGFWSDRTNPFDTKPFDESAVLEQIPEGSFREAIKEYYAAVKAWRQSDEVRDAPRWLSNALVDLEARGLLQWDHHNGTFDLHPVVRGYSVNSLNVDARGRAGQRVADYFSSRPKPNYHSAASSVDDLSNDLQVVRALNLAGKTWQAWSVLSTSLRAALRRLECHHELLALLRPLFPDGWNSPPRCISDPAVAANEAASALHHIGYIEKSMAQEVYAIRGDLANQLNTNLSARVRNHFITARFRNDLARSRCILTLARDIALAGGGNDDKLWCDILGVEDLTDRGLVNDALKLWTDIVAGPTWPARGRHVKSAALCAEARLLTRERCIAAADFRTAIDQVREFGYRTFERRLWFAFGDWYQLAEQDLQASDAFARAIEMARAVGLSDTNSEARRGLSLARLGRRPEAEAAAASAECDPPHVSLAELYLTLEQRDQARMHALAGYKWAWADGPPWCHHWDLQRCRAVLQALGEKQPQLPPFDPTKVKPIDYEPNIRRLLPKHAKKR